MPFLKTDINGLLVFEPRVFEDSRGYFYEAYNEQTFNEAGVNCQFIQDNQSKSFYGVIRGLHYQLAPFAQTKLVRVLEGRIIDVAVDIRKGSPTFGKHLAVELSADNKKQLFLPAGFAHGFSVLSETAIVLYKCDAFYSRENERGIRFDDAALNINWMIDPSRAIVSDKDLELPAFDKDLDHFQYEG
ncbi:MAG: dTDP-4-dehydrorhamnose 3,5-epimerase [Flavitalea sp.]